MVKTLWEIPVGTEINVQVLNSVGGGSASSDDGTPVANTVLNDIYIGV